MYNKLFTKILDSSIWLEPTCTRIVWLTLLAAMDEDGYSQFASVANLAYRARVLEEEAAVAVASLEGPDINSSDQDNDGRRIERIPGGWMVLNAQKYRDLVTRTVIKEQTRMRVARFRKSKNLNQSNAPVTVCNDPVTPSDTDTDTNSKKNTCTKLPEGFQEFWDVYPKRKAKGEALRSWKKLSPTVDLRVKIIASIRDQVRAPDWIKDGGQYIPLPATWLNQARWEDEISVKSTRDYAANPTGCFAEGSK